MKQSKAFIATLRDNPRDAEIISHQLMMRGGMIRKHAAGIYSYLPLLVKSYHKFCQIVREEFDKIGWQEVIMPFVVPSELWKESGRWGAYGKELARLKDRKDTEFCLGPTHEEVVTDIVRAQVNSYKQLPLTLFQITGKFRDEIRPRFGLMRGREFVMMDGYSFHADTADLDRHYEEISGAYKKIFERAGLRFVRVEADTGAIGGSGSHEYHVLAQSGEDAILSCAKCGYGANLEKAENAAPERQKKDWGRPTSEVLKEVSTPTQKTIEDVSALLKVAPHRNLKTLVFRYLEVEKPTEWRAVVAFVAGDRQLNEVKLKAAIGQSGVNVLDMQPMPEADVQKLFNCPVGFLGPIGAPSAAKIFYDRELSVAHDLVAGANKEGFHVMHLELARDVPNFASAQIKDLVTALKGEPCPRCADGVYEENRGIEVGHIFKLGSKYSTAMDAKFQDANKEQKVFEMGCYGIGMTRVIAACIEQNNDAEGIIWPAPLAPFDIHLVSLSPDDAEVSKVADEFYAELRKQGFDVLYDERLDTSPGVKFKDADLFGVPKRIVVGKKGLQNGEIEFVLRRGKEKKMIKFDKSSPSAVAQVCAQVTAT